MIKFDMLSSEKIHGLILLSTYNYISTGENINKTRMEQS